MVFYDDAVRSDDQQPLQGSLARLLRGPEALLAPGRMLAWCQTQPGDKVARPAECLARSGQDRNGCGDERPDAGHCHQPPGHFVLFGSVADFAIEFAYLRFETGKRFDHHIQSGDGIDGLSAVRVLDDGGQKRGVHSALRHDLSELDQMAAKSIDQLRARPDQKFAVAEDHRGPMGLFTLQGNKTHRRPLRRFTDRLGIGHVILRALLEGLHIGRWDQPHLMVQFPDLPAPEMGATAGLQGVNAARQLAENARA